jgi:hypothetical protein
MKNIIFIISIILSSQYLIAQRIIQPKKEVPIIKTNPTKNSEKLPVFIEENKSPIKITPTSKGDEESKKIIENLQKIGSGFRKNGNEVWIFPDINFFGTSKHLVPGRYTKNQLGAWWNDKISGLIVPKGFVLVVFEDDNFEGKWEAITNECGGGDCDDCWSYSCNADLTKKILAYGEIWNDRISSVIIFNNADYYKSQYSK